MTTPLFSSPDCVAANLVLQHVSTWRATSLVATRQGHSDGTAPSSGQKFNLPVEVKITESMARYAT